MNNEYEQALYETFPEYFEPEEIRRDPHKSCMAWGFAHANGWYIIIWQILARLRQFCPTAKIRVAQVKEKFGDLRFYYDILDWGEDGPGSQGRFDTLIEDIVDYGEHLTRHMCEFCGIPAKHRYDGWHMTLCDKHYEEWKNGHGLTVKDYSS